MALDNNSIFHKFSLFICCCLNLLPIFHVSRDEKFDDVDCLTELRLSLIWLPWGDKHLYFLSYSQQSSLELFSVLKLSDLQPFRQREELKQYADRFLNLNDDTDSLKSQLRIEFLKYKHTDCQNSINTLNNKVNSYLAIALAYAGLFAFLLQSILKLNFSSFSMLMWVVFILSGINLINILVLLRRYLQVKANNKSTFNSFKDDPTWRLLAKSIYIDWLTSNEERTVAASLVMNIEKYLIRSIFMSSLLLFLIVLHPYKLKVPLAYDKTTTNEFILLDEDGNFSPQELLKLSKVDSSDNTIVFVYSSSNISGKNTANFMINTLKLSNKSLKVKLNSNLFNNKMLVATIADKK